jgi:hypothetical protein
MMYRQGLLGWVFLASLAGGCFSFQETALPDQILGVWTTEAPRYADRFFELQKDKVIFGTGAGESDSNLVVAVEEVRQDRKQLYNIEYLSSEGQTYTFSFYYQTSPQTIALKNQSGIEWKKERR